MSEKKINVFLIATEYHFLVVLSIINEYFDSDEFFNRVVFSTENVRLEGLIPRKFPNFIHELVKVNYNKEKSLKQKVQKKILEGPVKNLFVVHCYRPLDTFVICSVSRSTKVHLMQDGALFYNNMERNMFLGNINAVRKLYLSLIDKGIFLWKFLYYPKFMTNSNLIDELWLTNYDEFVDKKTTKKLNIFRLLNNEQIVDQALKSFGFNSEVINNCLFYLSTKMYEEKDVLSEIELVKKFISRFKTENCLIKMHPASREFHQDMMKEEFGEDVLINRFPAELYLSKLRNSIILGGASTSLFFKVPTNEYYSIQDILHEKDLYASWKQINLPEHIIILREIDLN